MKTRTRANTKVAPKAVLPSLQTTLARQSISRDSQENLGEKKGDRLAASSNSNLSSHHLGAIALLPKRTATTSPSIGDRITPKTIHPKQSHQAIQNINSSPQQIQRMGS